MNTAKKERAHSMIVSQQRLGEALRNLPDRSALSRSSLARVSYVQRLADERYRGRLMARGLALREVLLGCVESVVLDIGNEPALSREREYLVLLKDGLSCKEISGRLGLSREHISRVYRKRALELVTEAFLRVVGNNEQG